MKRRKKQNYILRNIVIVTFISMLLFLISYMAHAPAIEIISPCPDTGCITPKQKPTITPFYTVTPTKYAPQGTLRGKASYYSLAGCLGCRADRLMANGEKLDDTRMTIAYNYAPMNTKVQVRNVDNGRTVDAIITDTGGFGPLGRIADLSVATRDAIGCADLCNIELVIYN